MDIEDLRTFINILESLSFTRTGDKLGRTQSAISLRIKKLEDELDCKLIERDGRMMRATAQGELLRNEAARLVEFHDRLKSSFKRKGIGGVLRLGVTDDVADGPLSSALHHFANEHPNIQIELSVDLTQHILARLKRSAFDVAVAKVDGSHQPTKILRTEPLIWCSQHGAQEEAPGVIPVVVFVDGSYPREVMLTHLTQAHIDWRISVVSSSLSGLRAAVEAGLGVTAIAAGAVRGRLKPAPASWCLPELPPAQTALFSVPSASPAQEAFIDFVSASFEV
ncbi:LysR substrate-binding domain-containing protein [Bradyrhizobium sp. NP1]|uniref:LysR family transcriptional regulator n=1 Tax=Bradyrhizobium sp. NP1 TaxID=3049772 RepID=UPI0025A67286|nr:LysR substrate-binding domain-containing protein [Bradyrhizobium sp. NP1]WJR76755.1 LysR substrate-binding domain-containing protein [Bradyrhizobium sp. NP1]